MRPGRWPWRGVAEVLVNAALILLIGLGVLVRRLTGAGRAATTTPTAHPAAEPAAAPPMAAAPPEAADTPETADTPPPPPPPAAEPGVIDRRRFLTRVSLAAGGASAAVAATPIVGALLVPTLREEEAQWRQVGTIGDFAVGATVKVTFLDATQLPWAGFAARSAAWLRRIDGQSFMAFSGYCTHVGCPVRWEAGAEMFMCPCHGGVFFRDGTVAAGPPPTALPRYPVRVSGDRVEIQTTPLPLPGQERME